MKRILAVLIFLVAAMPAQAHFIWLLPPKDRDGTEAVMIFSDTLAPDADVKIAKIEQTKLYAFAGKGDGVEVQKKEGTDLFHVIPKFSGKGMVVVAGVCQYGVVARGKGDPFLLMYYPKTIWRSGASLKGEGDWMYSGRKELALEILPVAKRPEVKIHWQGKPAANVEVELIIPGSDKKIERKTDEGGLVSLKDLEPKAGGFIGVLAKKVEAKEGKFEDKAYKEIRHYATFTMYVPERRIPKEKEKAISFPDEPTEPKADAAATKLLTEARGSRAAWDNFPGFSADLSVNHNGKVHSGKVQVNDKGKVTVSLEDQDVQKAARREIASLVSHRMPGPKTTDTPCAFGDESAEHPLGRAIKVLGDDMHSNFRIKDKQIMEVNRSTKDGRFTITVLENAWTKEKKYLPMSYVVNSWAADKSLTSSRSHHQTWTRAGDFDLPATLLVVTATSDGLNSHLFTFSNIKLSAR